MKPDVLEQIKKIEAERAEMIHKMEEQQRAMGGNQIILQKDGEPPQVLTAQDAVNIMQQQQQYIGELQKQHAEKDKRIKDLENMVLQLQTQIINRNKQTNSPTPAPSEILVKDGNDVINIAPQDSNELPKSVPLLTVEAD
jgi:hypothetical protein